MQMTEALLSGCCPLHSFTLLSATGYLEMQGHLRVHLFWSSIKDIFQLFASLYVTIRIIRAKKNSNKKTRKEDLFDRRLLPHI